MLTYAFVVDNTAQQPIVAQSSCQEVLIMENNQAGTTDYYVYAPLATNSQVTRPAGSTTSFRPGGPGLSPLYFKPGQIVGYVKTVSGSITMGQVEN